MQTTLKQQIKAVKGVAKGMDCFGCWDKKVERRHYAKQKVLYDACSTLAAVALIGEHKIKMLGEIQLLLAELLEFTKKEGYPDEYYKIQDTLNKLKS